MKDLKEFKEEFRFRNTDTWGDALEAWFEAVGQMNKRGLPIPPKWKYKAALDFPGCNDKGTDPESPWHEDFEATETEVLIVIAHFLDRYCGYLKFKEVNY